MSSSKYFDIVYFGHDKYIYNKIEIECLFTFNLNDKESEQENIKQYYTDVDKKKYLLFSEYRYKINIDFKSIEDKLKEDGYTINKYNFNPNIICIPIDIKKIIKAKENKDNEQISKLFKKNFPLNNNENDLYCLRINEISDIYKSKDFAGKIIFPPYSLRLNIKIIENFSFIYKESLYKLTEIEYCYKYLNDDYICKCNKDLRFIPNNNTKWSNQNPLYVKIITVVS